MIRWAADKITIGDVYTKAKSYRNILCLQKTKLQNVESNIKHINISTSTLNLNCTNLGLYIDIYLAKRYKPIKEIVEYPPANHLVAKRNHP